MEVAQDIDFGVHVKTWFITGASRGFGRQWAQAALDRGDNVAATARDPRTLDALVDAYGDAVLPIRLDVTDRAEGLDRKSTRLNSSHVD